MPLNGKRIVIGPMNIAHQPAYLASGLRRAGVEARSVIFGDGNFGYEADVCVDLPKSPAERTGAVLRALTECLDADIFHIFQRPFFMPTPPKKHDSFIGFELPLLKLRGKRIAYRFTGWELIDKKLEMERNPYSAFHHGWDGHFDETLKKEYLAYLREVCDVFMVVDPMMQEHCPDAKIVPRILPVDNFQEVGIERKDRPLVVHAPTNPIYKGSKFILQALEELKDEGLSFDLEVIGQMPFKEALKVYSRADVIVDQILIGWYGVLATECMAMGKPIAVYMREDLPVGDIPIHNINIDNVKSKLRELISDYDLRLHLASQSRAYVERVHSEAAVIPKLISVYEDILAKPGKRPAGTDDLLFFALQRRAQEEVNAVAKHAERLGSEKAVLQKELMQMRYKVRRLQEWPNLRKMIRRVLQRTRRAVSRLSKLNSTPTHS